MSSEMPLKTVKSSNAQWKRYIKVFRAFMNGDTCRFCDHNYRDHAGLVRQPHFFRLRSAHDTSLEYVDDDGTSLTKMVVARAAELEELCCQECAEEIGTSQVVCWQKSVARGEIVGVRSA